MSVSRIPPGWQTLGTHEFWSYDSPQWAERQPWQDWGAASPEAAEDHFTPATADAGRQQFAPETRTVRQPRGPQGASESIELRPGTCRHPVGPQGGFVEEPCEIG